MPFSSKFFLVAIAALITSSSCNWIEEEKAEGEPLAKVNDRYLYAADLEPVLKYASSPEDSALRTKEFIDNWIREQLLLAKAESYLPDNMNEIEAKVRDYRESLIVHTYESQLIKERLDTAVTREEVETFYAEHMDMFVLAEDVVQLKYMVLPIETAQLDSAKMLIKLKGKLNQQRLADYCYMHAYECMVQDSAWLSFNTVYKKFPIEREALMTLCKFNRSGNVRDEEYVYLIKVNNFKAATELAPVNYVIEEIKKTILHKRKHELLEGIYQQAYEEGVKDKLFETY